jgi:hypothetical protein
MLPLSVPAYLNLLKFSNPYLRPNDRPDSPENLRR